MSHPQRHDTGWWEAVSGSFLFLKWSCQPSWRLLVCPTKHCGGRGRQWVLLEEGLWDGRWHWLGGVAGEERNEASAAWGGQGLHWRFSNAVACMSHSRITQGACPKYRLQGPNPRGDFRSVVSGRTFTFLGSLSLQLHPEPAHSFPPMCSRPAPALSQPPSASELSFISQL